MKKGINKSILFYVVSALFLIASAIGLTTGNENTMAIIWLSLGSAFLCLGSTYKKKENNKTNTDDKQFPACIVGKSVVMEVKNVFHRRKRLYYANDKRNGKSIIFFNVWEKICFC